MHPSSSAVRGVSLAFGLACFLWTGGATALAATIRVPADHPTIGAAIAAATDGDTVLVIGGNYAEVVQVPSLTDFTLKGKAGAAITATTSGPTPLRLLGCQRTRVTGFAIVGGGTAGILVEECTDIRVDKCDVRAGDGHGILVQDSVRAVVSKCVVSDRGMHGILIEQAATTVPTENVVDRCRVDRAGSWGIRADDGTGHVFSRNRVFDSGVVGMEFFSSNGLMERNVVKRTKTFACLAIRGVNNVCRKNRAEGAKFEGIFVIGSGHTIERNVLRDSVYGISCPGESCDLLKNVIDTTSLDGIFLIGGTGNTVEGNRISNTTEAGIEVRSNSNTVSGNQIKKPALFGIEISGGDNQVSSNRVVKAMGSAFVLEPASNLNVLSGNKAKKSAGLDLEDVSLGQNTLIDNDFATIGP